MSKINWGMISDGGTFESLMHAILYAEDPGTVLFGRPGKDAGQDACSSDVKIIYQAKFRKDLTSDNAIKIALKELIKINKYRDASHSNSPSWEHAQRWVLFANFRINSNFLTRWRDEVIPAYQKAGLNAEYWDKDIIENKLIDHPGVRDTFFSGENRVLVGLKEAHEILTAECLGSSSLNSPMVGRETEMETIRAFVDSDDKCVLPILGIGGSGKTRLAFECLKELGQSGWRTLWALPNSMAKSTHWFNMLNGTQKTSVVIDDPDDQSLVRTVIEQLMAAERRNWKVIINLRPEKKHYLNTLKDNSKVDQPLEIKPLNESTSITLLTTLLEKEFNESWLHSIYTYTNGVPGWMSLISELINNNKFSEQRFTTDSIAKNYLDSCLDQVKSRNSGTKLCLLRWISLFGDLSIDSENNKTEIEFLISEGIAEKDILDILNDFKETGLIRNWGIKKRKHAISSLVIRDYILSDWLLTKNKNSFQVSQEGTRIIERLVEGQIPATEKVLGVLSSLTKSRLDEASGFRFLKPFFVTMGKIAKEGSTLDQFRVIDLVDKIGLVDPENALDLIQTVQNSPQEDVTIDNMFWGSQTFSHNLLLTKIPSLLYKISQIISDTIAAKRYLLEFETLISITKGFDNTSERHESAEENLKRILHNATTRRHFLSPAIELAGSKITSPEAWPFILPILEIVMNPEYEHTEWGSTFKLIFEKKIISPQSKEWKQITELRDKILDHLPQIDAEEDRVKIWHILSETHHEIHRTTRLSILNTEAKNLYKNALVNDLAVCNRLLSNKINTLTINEATQARNMWSWYLKYGKDQNLIKMATACEDTYNKISKWRMQDFFRFDKEENLAPETERVVRALEEAKDIKVYIDFFEEAARYLKAARGQTKDMADFMRISKLSDSLIHKFSLPIEENFSTINQYILSVLKNNKPEDNEQAWQFSIRICQLSLRNEKNKGHQASKSTPLRELLNNVNSKAEFIYSLFSNAHPHTTGELTQEEFASVLEYINKYDIPRCFVLLGAFSNVDWDTIKPILEKKIGSIKLDIRDKTHALSCFIRSVELCVLRYEWNKEDIPVDWIFNSISKYNLNGELLSMHETTFLRDKATYRLSIDKIYEFIKTRIELEQRPKPYPDFRVLPSDFSIDEWCKIDKMPPELEQAFHNFCRLIFSSGYIGSNLIPKYVTKLDPTGQNVARFVEQHLSNTQEINPDELSDVAELASYYMETTEAWASISTPVCLKAQTLRREEREHVYLGLYKKETGVISSSPGDTPEYYDLIRDDAKRMLNEEPKSSPLREYREWSLRYAESSLKQAQGFAEEHFYE